MVVDTQPNIVVFGLGYVGLPLAVALARQFQVTGFDIDAGRIAGLRRHHDRTGEIDEGSLAASPATFTSDLGDCRGADIYIVTVPTPVDDKNRPDLRPLQSASTMVGKAMDGSRRPIVVFESTVYPGVTEDFCGPLLEKESGLSCGTDFFLGYSPERINPGDREHTIDRIVKVVAGQDEETLETLARVYGTITSAGVFRAASIKAAEAAKVIENAQRDINIAFINEVTQIFNKLDLSIWDVLEAAGTKWNFLKFVPGLVGGHCIGVDPFYLSHLAQQLGHEPNVILAGRSINDRMGRWIADYLHERRNGRAGSVLVLGLTFKEDVPDLRNSRVIDVIRRFEELGHKVTVHDPRAHADEARHEYGIELAQDALDGSYDLIVAAVPHAEYQAIPVGQLATMVNAGGCVADIKGMWRRIDFGPEIDRWTM